MKAYHVVATNAAGQFEYIYIDDTGQMMPVQVKQACLRALYPNRTRDQAWPANLGIVSEMEMTAGMVSLQHILDRSKIVRHLEVQ
jgi:hypothetical protein